MKKSSLLKKKKLFPIPPKIALQQLLGELRTPPKSQAPAMPPPLRKEEGKQETKEDAEYTGVVRNLDL